jgi:hypothetical protein
MDAMLVLTVKRDGGTQDVLGFYPPIQLSLACEHARQFLEESMCARRAIIRLELYNPKGAATKAAYEIDRSALNQIGCRPV